MKPIDGLKGAKQSEKTICLPMHEVLAKDDVSRSCANCEYVRDNGYRCTYDYIVKTEGPDVKPGWCCDFFKPVEKK